MKKLIIVLTLLSFALSVEISAKERNSHREKARSSNHQKAEKKSERKHQQQKQVKQVRQVKRQPPTIKPARQASTRKPIASSARKRVTNRSQRTEDALVPGTFNGANSGSRSTVANKHQKKLSRYSVKENTRQPVKQNVRHRSGSSINSDRNYAAKHHKPRNHGQRRYSNNRHRRESIAKQKHRRHSVGQRNQQRRYSQSHFRGQHRYSRWYSGHGHYHYDYNYRSMYNSNQWYDDYYYQSYFDWRWNQGNYWSFGSYYNGYDDPYYCPDGFTEFVTGLAIGALIYNW